MKKRTFTCTIFFFFLYSFLGFCPTYATVFWHNNPAITQNVVNENIDIIGTNTLVGGIHVQASSSNIVITVTNSDSIIAGSNEAQLYLSVAQSRKITFSLAHNLTFQGSATFDLLVSVTGGGEVEFLIGNGKKVSFTSAPGTQGAQFFVGMGTPNDDPTLSFKRLTPGSGDVEIVVGANSGITYIAETDVALSPDEEGSIIFYPSNTGSGDMILRLQDGSYFVIYGHQVNVPLSNDFTLADIDFSTLAGLHAFYRVQNASCAFMRVINENTQLTKYMIDPFCEGSFTGTQFGFILGANAELHITASTYFDYIGTKTNGVPTVSTPLANVQDDIVDLIECGKISGVQDLIKDRNPSAFIVDGSTDPAAQPAKITMDSSSAIYFRSGVDCNGDVSPSFTIDYGQESSDAGAIVFDVEGPLDVIGNSPNETGLNVLSLEVDETGCPVTVESTGPDCFPQRTFAKDADGNYVQYNRAAWLINNRMNIVDSSLIHTDEAHDVYDRNNLGRSDLSSEPTYVGGETFYICKSVCPIPRPTIAFYNSIFRVHTNVGLTGVDFRVPNCSSHEECDNGNTTIFRFYNNGRCIDNAYGRIMVLGTDVGSFSNCGQLISQDSHLDVFQESTEAVAQEHELQFDVGINTTCITEGISGDISGQFAVQSIFLNNASNISIGIDADTLGTASDCTTFALTTSPVVSIMGDFFSFETAGGLWCLPEAGGTTGQGAIFVDKNATFRIEPRLRASIATMVVKSRNGIIDLPQNQVFFDSRVGITQWKIDLTQSNQRVLIPASATLSDFTMDWGEVKKDYCTSNSFVPYEPPNTPLPCDCPPVFDENLRALPRVEGHVDQFQIKRARIGDQAHLQVAGGTIRELVMLSGNNTAEAPVGFIVVQDEGFVGLGTAHRNVDSLEASIKLGINGITICANGNGTVELNENVLVDNVCHIVTGTSFGVGGAETLTIHSYDTKEFRVKSTGLLDLTQFNTSNKILKFAGRIKIVFEPGSRLVLGGGTVTFTDQVELGLERVLNLDLLVGTMPSDLDPIRVKIIGKGQMVFEENSVLNLFQDSFLGIESDVECDLNTTITWLVLNQATINVGTQSEPGGALQIGNTTDLDDATVDFTLILNGVGAEFQINRQGFVGFGVGMANKVSSIPNQWLVNCLDNVGVVSISIPEGTFSHNQIRSGDNSTASLLAIGPNCDYTLFFDLVKSVILGGGNLVLLKECVVQECTRIDSIVLEKMSPESRATVQLAQDMLSKAEAMMAQAKAMMLMFTRGRSRDNEHKIKGAIDLMGKARTMQTRAQEIMRAPTIASINPIVQNTNGEISANLEVGIMSGKLLLRDFAKGAQPVNVVPQAFFDYLKTLPVTSQASPRANIFRDQIELSTLGYVAGSTIVRLNIQRILGSGGNGAVDHDHSLRIGAASINIDDDSFDPIDVIEIRGSDGF